MGFWFYLWLGFNRCRRVDQGNLFGCQGRKKFWYLKKKKNLLCLTFFHYTHTWGKTSNPLALPDLYFSGPCEAQLLLLLWLQGVWFLLHHLLNVSFSNHRLKRYRESHEKVSEKSDSLKAWFQDLLINNKLFVCLLD